MSKTAQGEHASDSSVYEQNYRTTASWTAAVYYQWKYAELEYWYLITMFHSLWYLSSLIRSNLHVQHS